MPASFYDENLIGELTSRLTTDTTLVEQAVGTSFSMAIRNLVLLIGSIIFILMTSAYLTLMMLVMTPFIVVPLIYLARKYRLLSKGAKAMCRSQCLCKWCIIYDGYCASISV